MKILFVSDAVVEHLYGPGIAKYRGVDVAIGCGDLPYYYLEFLQSMLNVPLFYVHGNHDPEQEFLPDGTAIHGPSGGFNLHARTCQERGMLLAGLEGSIRYGRTNKFQYSQLDMWLNTFYLIPRLMLNKLRYGRYIDLLITHAPPFGIHNGDDYIHEGFKSFLWLMKRFKPRYLMHGHQHVYDSREITKTQFDETTIINIYPYKILDVEVT